MIYVIIHKTNKEINSGSFYKLFYKLIRAKPQIT